jgi:hypothetical protein
MGVHLGFGEAVVVEIVEYGMRELRVDVGSSARSKPA